MALVIKDRVRVTSTSTGTGTITLGSAVTGFQDFGAIGDGETTYYCIAGQGTTEWEVGVGTYTASGTTLSRTTVLASSNAGSLVTFSAGIKDVFATYPAEKAVITSLTGAALIADVNSNVAIGNEATFSSNTTGINNTATGPWALNGNTEGSYNVAVGESALTGNTTGDYNVAIGAGTLLSNTTGSYNIAIGSDALYNNTEGSSIAIGSGALLNQTTGSANIVIGDYAAASLTTGLSNVVIGVEAAGSLTTGTGNSVFGDGGLGSNSTGDRNTAIGKTALNSVTGSYNVGIGNYAGAYETGSNTFYVDNQDRTDTAGDKAGALLYGTFNATPSAQTLKINAAVQSVYGLTSNALIESTSGGFKFPDGTTQTTAGITSMTYPGAGVAVSTGSAWGTSLTAPTGALVGTSDTQNLTNKTLDNTNTVTLKDTLFTIQDATDTTKQVRFDVNSAQTTGTTSTFTFPTFSTGTLAIVDNSQTWTGTQTFNGSVALNGSSITSSSSTIGLGTSSATSQYQFGYGSTTSGNTKTINIGTNGLSGSTTTMAIGSTNGTTVAANGTWTFGTTISGSVTGNAGTVTNGVYTTGSYADPSWITSINYTKLTGTVPTWNQNTTGYAADVGGGATNEILYQTAANSTSYITAPSVTNTFLKWNGTTFVWDTAGGGSGSPGGSTTQLQYNNAGAFGGISTLTYDGTTVSSSADMNIHGLTVGLGGGAEATNVVLGTDALVVNTTGYGNLAIGSYSLNSNTVGVYNTAIGGEALFSNIGGQYNTAIGSVALYNNTEGDNNTAIGFQSMAANTTGYANTAIGGYSLNSNTTGYDNLAIGKNALYVNTTGFSNTAVGNSALRNNTTGTKNVALGTSALFENTTANSNIAVGYEALYNNTTGYSNVAVGDRALQRNFTGFANFALGDQALYNNNSGQENVAVGRYSLLSNVTGNENIAIGRSTLSENVNGTGSVAIGSDALASTSTVLSTVTIDDGGTGYTDGVYTNILLEVDGPSITGDAPLATVTVSGGVITDVVITNGGWGFDREVTQYFIISDPAVGPGTGFLATATLTDYVYGTNNVAIGKSALLSNIAGSNNVALGSSAGKYETTSNNFYVDNQDRVDTAGDKAGALLYGTFNADPTLQTLKTNSNFFVSQNIKASKGVHADGPYDGTFTDGIAIDYDTTPGGGGRISVGGGDDLLFYNGGIAGSLLGKASSNGDWTISRFLSVGNGTLIGGTTNPLIAAGGSADGYVEVYCHNDNSGTSASSDFVAYPDNGADATGWLDVGINSSTFSDAAYSITSPNEGYVLMSNPSTATTATGNMVFATDSTGTDNAFQWYVGGFTQAKSAYKMQLNGTNLLVKQAIQANGVIESTTGGFKFPDGTTQTTAATGGSGSGTVTDVSVVSANGFAGTVATSTTTPAITVSTTVTGLLKGNGTAISAATSGTDYAPATSGTSILYGNGAGAFSNVTVGSGLSFSAGTLSSTATGTVTSVDLALPSEFSISGNPVTTSGTLTGSWTSQTANTVFAAPNGSTGTPSFRTLVSNDIPDLLLTKLPEAWVKMSVQAATTANITLSGTQTIDGVALVAGNRCLVKNQTAAQDNGIYDVSAGAWTRSADASTITEIAGAAVNVDAGTVNGGKIYDTDLKTTDTLGTTAMNWYSLVDINGATFVGSITARAGTATAGTAPIYLQSGTNLTTAAAGAIEYDGNTYYSTIAASTRGVMPSEQIVVLTGTNTLTSQTAVQPIFDGGGGPTNGSVTLPIGTYMFECSFALTGMSATSGSFGFALGGAATKTYAYNAQASKGTGTSLTTATATTATYNTGAQTTLNTAGTGTAGTAVIKGIIRVTVAGTVIPQVSLTVASAAVIQAGSYFKVSPLGNVSTVATVGNWI